MKTEEEILKETEAQFLGPNQFAIPVHRVYLPNEYILYAMKSYATQEREKAEAEKKATAMDFAD